MSIFLNTDAADTWAGPSSERQVPDASKPQAATGAALLAAGVVIAALTPAHPHPHGCRACPHDGPLMRHATRHSWWRDVPQDGRPQYRRGHIVRWRCPSCGHTHAHQPEWALPGKRMTRALDDWLARILAEGHSARAVALRCGLDAKTVRTWLRERGLPGD